MRLDTYMSYQLSKKEVPPPWVSSFWREVLQGLGLDELAPPGMKCLDYIGTGLLHSLPSQWVRVLRAQGCRLL